MNGDIGGTVDGRGNTLDGSVEVGVAGKHIIRSLNGNGTASTVGQGNLARFLPHVDGKVNIVLIVYTGSLVVHTAAVVDIINKEGLVLE